MVILPARWLKSSLGSLVFTLVIISTTRWCFLSGVEVISFGSNIAISDTPLVKEVIVFCEGYQEVMVRKSLQKTFLGVGPVCRPKKPVWPDAGFALYKSTDI